MLKRINRVRSVFNKSKWEEERVEMEKRIREMSEFDDTGNPKGFSAGVSKLKPLENTMSFRSKKHSQSAHHLGAAGTQARGHTPPNVKRLTCCVVFYARHAAGPTQTPMSPIRASTGEPRLHGKDSGESGGHPVASQPAGRPASRGGGQAPPQDVRRSVSPSKAHWGPPPLRTKANAKGKRTRRRGDRRAAPATSMTPKGTRSRSRRPANNQSARLKKSASAAGETRTGKRSRPGTAEA